VAVAAVDRSTSSGINVGDAERWVSIAAGSLLAAYGLARRDAVGGAAVMGGAALLFRGGSGYCALYEAMDVDHARQRGTGRVADRQSDTRRRLGGANGIHVEQTVTINKPVNEVYRFWRDLENLPKFMVNLETVAEREEGVSHWVARGPAGLRVEWDARIINDIENRVIGWQSLEGSTVATAGSVTFEETDRGTRVRVHLQYNPPGGRAGALVAKLLGDDPDSSVREDLRRFKRLLETGEIPTTKGQPSGRRQDWRDAVGVRGREPRREREREEVTR